MDESDDVKAETDDTMLLKSAIHFTVYKLSQECSREFKTEFSRSVVQHIAELTFQMLEAFGRDLVLFAKHAKRSKIGPEDVKLVFRNNPTMCNHLDLVLTKLSEGKAKKSKKKQKEKEATLDASHDDGQAVTTPDQVNQSEVPLRQPLFHNNENEMDLEFDNDNFFT